jgi:uncharacterized protein (TIGR02452 family)
MKRSQRKQFAEETIKIIEAGEYLSPSGSIVDIRQDLKRSYEGTVLYTPNDFPDLLEKVRTLSLCHVPEIQVLNITSLEAAKMNLSDSTGKVCCLNFASAKNPGGGFLNGSQAQEESLARSSGLYHSITSVTEFYSHHRSLDTCLYSDHMIYSPDVPVFRDDEGVLLERPHNLSFITSPAVNAGAVRRNEPPNVPLIVPVLRERAKKIMLVAAINGCSRIILGAWGCGVFANDPADVAGVFAELLRSDHDVKGLFTQVIFAVYDKSPEQSTYKAFEDVFGGAMKV